MPRTIYYERFGKNSYTLRSKKLHFLIISFALFLSVTSEGCSVASSKASMSSPSDESLSSLPVITSATSASGSVGTAFSYQITATNSPWRYGATGLPTGVTLNARTGLISGTPTTAGTYEVTVEATNRRGTGTATLTATISGSAPVISSAATASGTVGISFSYQIAASNSPSSYGAAGLPAGLGLNSTTGLISGTPSASGTSTVTLSASNSGGTGSASLTITIVMPIPAITSATTATGTAGSAFAYQITATNSPTSYGAAGLPAGLSVNSTTGLISGTSSSTGTSAITLSASNSGGTGTASLALTINSASASSATFTVAPATLAFGNQPVDTTSSAQVATVSNSGSTALTISSISLTGSNASEYSETNTCGAALPAGGSCTIAIQFTPAAFGTGVATLNVSSNSGSNSQTVALSGSGAHDVILSWTGSTTYGVVGYNVYRGTASGSESSTPLNSSPVSGLTYVDSSVQTGQEYFYYITAVGSGGTAQSPPSNEASATVPSQ